VTRRSDRTLRHVPLQPVGRAAGAIRQKDRIEVGNAILIGEIVRPFEILRIERVAAGQI
jgi:hypothetical protein